MERFRLSAACDAGRHDACEREHVERGVTGCAVVVRCGCGCAHTGANARAISDVAAYRVARRANDARVSR